MTLVKAKYNRSVGYLPTAKPMAEIGHATKRSIRKQSDRFVRERSSVMQYAIDVLAGAFLVSLLFIFLDKVWK